MNTKTLNDHNINEKLDSAVELGASTVKKAVEATQKGYDKSVKQASDGLSKVADQTLKSVEDLTKNQKESNQALGEIASIIKKTTEDVSKEALSNYQNLVELQLKASQDSLNAKNLQELTQIQSEVANKIYNDFVATTNKITKETHNTVSKIAENYNQLFEKYTNKGS